MTFSSIQLPVRVSCFLRGAIAAATLSAAGVLAGTPGLDGPEAIGPFLNGTFPDTEPTGASEWTVQETYTGININLPMHLTPYPGTNQLLCVAKDGRIHLFDDDPAANQTELFLDMSGEIFTSSDSGMTYLVFHPEFGVAGSPNRGYVYITYKWRPSGTGNAAYWRLSRFTVEDGTRVANRASELILIQQYDRQQFHDAGCMLFGPDGYLYVSIGDEGGANDEYNVAQKINSRLFSGILRIDVDRKESNHEIRRQPAAITMPAGWPASFTAHYKIPADNPFVDPSGGTLEEFYAIGLRQPYRFSRDAVSNRIWIAESGQDTREEIDILAAGANYGWPFREGSISRPTGPQPPAIPAVIHGTLTEPVWDVAHGTDNCIIGGFVYRGTAFPELVGKYITVDNVTSHIRAHVLENNVATNQILTDMPSGSVYSGTSTIGMDTAGEPVFVKINGTGSRGRFFKLAAISAAATRSGWFRFDDLPESNTSLYVSDNPENTTANSVLGGVPLVAFDNETSTSANVKYITGSGLSPTGFPANSVAVRMAAGDADGRPGNGAGDLTTAAKLGVFDDFTIELSFHPNTGSLGSGYQTFLGLEGMTGTAPGDGEAGPPLQPFRLMRWGRNDAAATTIPLENGDLFLNIRTLDPATAQWTSGPIHVLDRTAFTAGKWYHLAIVGDVSAGTVTVYSHDSAAGTYTVLGQASGYAGNLKSGIWSLGRGTYNNNAADWVNNADFDEFRITDRVLQPSQFLYGNQPFLPVIPATDAPPLLSQTGAFSDLATLTPAPGIIPYDVNTPLWSDGSAKQRWIALPNDGSHDSPEEKISFHPEEKWEFPAGTVFIKHFELPVNDADPSVLRRLETRFIVMPAVGEPYGVTYKWREDGSDADLIDESINEVIDISTTAGGTRQQTWTYPGRNECRVCHNGNADHVLGVTPWQLNRDFTYPATGRTSNQLETLGDLGWFDGNYRADLVPWMLKSHGIVDGGSSLTDRVRSYLDSNCSQCHQPGGVRAFFDARYTTPLEEQGLVRGDLETSYGHPDNRLIVPGQPDRSILLLRLGSTEEIKMPPIAKHLVDEPAVQLLTDWINVLSQGPTVALAASGITGGNLHIDVKFSHEVSGLETSDFNVTNGTASSLTGSGTDYTLAISPADHGDIIVKLPAAAALDIAGNGNYASPPLVYHHADEGFIAWLRLDESAGNLALDSAGSGLNNGVLIDMETTDRVPGRSGGALSFDNTDERITMPNIVGEDFSISFWMKTTQTFPEAAAPAQGTSIFSADLPGAARDFIIGATRNGAGINRISFHTGWENGSPNSVLHGTRSVYTGEWVHVVVTRTRTTGQMTLHIDGELESSMTGSTSLLNGNPELSIGASPARPANSYEGLLDDLRIYGRVLGPEEITALGEAHDPVSPYARWVGAWLPGIYHLQAADRDPERDGNSNFAEFAFGGNPLAPDVIPVPLERAADGTVSIAYRARRDAAPGAYRLLTTGDLHGWSDASADIVSTDVQPIQGTDYDWVTVTYAPPDGGAARFFKVEARE